MKSNAFRRGLRSVLIVPLIAALATGTSTAASHRGAPPQGAFTTLAATPLGALRPVRGADGQQHLAYELQLINPTRLTVTIDRIETLDAADGMVLATLEGDAVTAQLSPLPPAQPTAPTIGPGGVAFVVLDVALPANVRPPRQLVHDLTLSLQPDVPEIPHVVRIGRIDVAREEPVIVDAPLAGDRWMDVQGCCERKTAHRGAANLVDGELQLAQRFAIDFVQLDAEGRLFDGPPDQLSSYPYYGDAVMAAAPGTVVAVQDGVPDNEPGTRPPVDVTQRTVPGNYVVVDIGGGRHAGYAHLQPSSLRVAVGDRVRRGQVIGLLGNSGNSDLPHLHFQVTDGPIFFGADGVAYEFRSFRSEGSVANPDEVISAEGTPAVIDPTLAGRHVRRLPLDLQLVDFGDPG